jgi:hypothetical protein
VEGLGQAKGRVQGRHLINTGAFFTKKVFLEQRGREDLFRMSTDPPLIAKSSNARRKQGFADWLLMLKKMM